MILNFKLGFFKGGSMTSARELDLIRLPDERRHPCAGVADVGGEAQVYDDPVPGEPYPGDHLPVAELRRDVGEELPLLLLPVHGCEIQILHSMVVEDAGVGLGLVGPLVQPDLDKIFEEPLVDGRVQDSFDYVVVRR